MSQNSEWHLAPDLQRAFWDNTGTSESFQVIIMTIDMNIEERQVSK